MGQCFVVNHLFGVFTVSSHLIFARFLKRVFYFYAFLHQGGNQEELPPSLGGLDTYNISLKDSKNTVTCG